MLVVRVELWDGGDPSRRQYLGGAAIANISDLAVTSDYLVALLDAGNELKDIGLIRRHTRSDGWPILISKAIRAALASSHATPEHRALAEVMAQRTRDS